MNAAALLADDALGLFAVADGVGAGSSGRLAADLVLESLYRHYSQSSAADQEQRLADGVRAANAALFARTSAARQHWDEQLKGLRAADFEITRWLGLGTSLVTLRLAGGSAFIAHVGDSHAYRYRNGKLAQLTMDDRLVDDAVALTGKRAPAFSILILTSLQVGNANRVPSTLLSPLGAL